MNKRALALTGVAAVVLAAQAVVAAGDTIPASYYLGEGEGGLVGDIPGATIEQVAPNEWRVWPPPGLEWLSGPAVKRLDVAGTALIDRLGLPWPSGTVIDGVVVTTALTWWGDQVRQAGDWDDGIASVTLTLIPLGTWGDGVVAGYVNASDTGERAKLGDYASVPDGGDSVMLLGFALGVVGVFLAGQLSSDPRL